MTQPNLKHDIDRLIQMSNINVALIAVNTGLLLITMCSSLYVARLAGELMGVLAPWLGLLGLVTG